MKRILQAVAAATLSLPAAGLFWGKVRAMSVRDAEGREAFSLAFPEPTQVLLQDNLRWGTPVYELRARRTAPYSARSTIVASSGNGPNASRRPSGQGTTSNSSTRISPASPSRDTSALTP